MKLLADSFWRASLYCLYPRVIGLSFLPLVVIVALSWLLGYLYWDSSLTWVRAWLDASSWLAVVWGWLEGIGLANLKTVVAPLLVIFTVTPIVVVASLLAVSFLMTPAHPVGRRPSLCGPAAQARGRFAAGFMVDFFVLVVGFGGPVVDLAHVVSPAPGHVVACPDLGLADLPRHGV